MKFFKLEDFIKKKFSLKKLGIILIRSIYFVLSLPVTEIRLAVSFKTIIFFIYIKLLKQILLIPDLMKYFLNLPIHSICANSTKFLRKSWSAQTYLYFSLLWLRIRMISTYEKISFIRYKLN